MRRGSLVKFSLITNIVALFNRTTRTQINKVFTVTKVDGHKVYINIFGVEKGFHELLLTPVKMK